MVSVRGVDEDTAKQLRGQLRQQHAVTLSQCEEQQRYSLRIRDVRSVTTVDEQLNHNLFNDIKFIRRFLVETVRDVVEKTIRNAQSKIKAIQNDHEAQVKALDAAKPQQIAALESRMPTERDSVTEGGSPTVTITRRSRSKCCWQMGCTTRPRSRGGNSAK
jgi:hypothetical protein